MTVISSIVVQQLAVFAPLASVMLPSTLSRPEPAVTVYWLDNVMLQHSEE